MSRHTRVLLAFALTAAVVWASLPRRAVAEPAPPPASQPATQPAIKTGRFQLTFAEKHPLSDTPGICKRMGWRLEPLKEFGQPMDYDPAKESYEVYVPAAYNGEEPYGLFVWVSPGPRGDLPQQFYDVIDRHRLIAIGPNNAGNNRELWNRMSLAMDAAHNMPKRYSIDARRVYVSGASGGGRTSSRLAMLFPEVFNGGFYQIGVDYHRPLEVEKGSNKFYKQAFQRAPKEQFTLTRDGGRHVLLTGETDPNRVQTKLTYDAMLKDGFKHVTYLEQPGLGHAPPDAEWFEKGIAALDDRTAAAEEPTPPKKGQPAKSPPATAKRPPTPATRPASARAPAPATPAATQPVAATQEADDAKMLRVAKLYVQNRLYTKARAKLNELLAAHPGTAAAKEAEAILKEIGKE